MKLLKLAIFVSLVALVLSSCTEANIEKVNTSSAQTPTSSDAVNTEVAKVSEVPTATLTDYKIGDSVKFDNLIITVNGIRKSKSELMQPKEGNEIILVDVTAENKGTKEASVSSMLHTEVHDGDGFKYNITITDDGKGSFDGSIGVGKKLRGEVAYEVPKDASSLEFIFSDPFKKGQAVWKLK